MHQGQICKIRMRTADGYDDIGWYQKLRTPDNAIRYCKVFGNNNTELTQIADSQVDDSLTNKRPTRPYEVTYVMPIEYQLNLLSANIDDDLERRLLNTTVKDGLRTLINQLTSDKDKAEKQCRLLSIELRMARQALDDVEIDMNPGFTYAYGRHYQNGTEFCWRVPFHLVSRVVPGVEVIVDTSRGEELAQITRVEKMPALLDHKTVIRIA